MTFPIALPFRLRRPARPTRPPARVVELTVGQRCDVALATGAHLRVLSGQVLLQRPPRWLGDTLVTPPPVRLAEGDGWTSAEREPVTLVGHGTARVALG